MVNSNFMDGNVLQRSGQNEKAEECIEFIVRSSNEHGLIGEQIDNSMMEPSWIVGLAWAHAMFILVN